MGGRRRRGGNRNAAAQAGMRPMVGRGTSPDAPAAGLQSRPQLPAPPPPPSYNHPTREMCAITLSTPSALLPPRGAKAPPCSSSSYVPAPASPARVAYPRKSSCRGRGNAVYGQHLYTPSRFRTAVHSLEAERADTRWCGFACHRFVRVWGAARTPCGEEGRGRSSIAWACIWRGPSIGLACG